MKRQLALAMGVLVLLGGCGEVPEPERVVAEQAPASRPGTLQGTWVLDLEHSVLTSAGQGLGATLAAAGRAPTPAPGAEAFRLLLQEGGAFELVVGQGEEAFRVQGRWSRTALGVELINERAEGVELEAELRSPERLRLDQGALVLETGGQRIALRRLEQP